MKQVFNTLMVIVLFLCITLIALEMAGPKQPQVNYPEEMELAEIGDKLMVEDINKDGIQLGFYNIKHQCDWEDCEHQGEIVDQNNFVSYWGYEEMTDGWCVEMTHFMNPEMTYEECDAYVMSGVE